MESEIVVAVRAARAGVEVVRAGIGTGPEVRLKGVVDPVTVVDSDAEEAIFAVLAEARPDNPVLGEESGGEGWDAERVWIVDPLDGTVNFIHGMPQVSVSVALWERGSPVAGVVIDVTRDEEFTAERGRGVWLNERPIRVSQIEDPAAALVVTGFPYDRQEWAGEYASTVGAVLAQVQGIRRLGSAALDFAWVACGRFDAYWEYGLGPWDAAAGLLLVQEAGGLVTDHTGREYDLASSTIVAGNPSIHARLREIVAANLPVHLR